MARLHKELALVIRNSFAGFEDGRQEALSPRDHTHYQMVTERVLDGLKQYGVWDREGPELPLLTQEELRQHAKAYQNFPDPEPGIPFEEVEDAVSSLEDVRDSLR